MGWDINIYSGLALASRGLEVDRRTNGESKRTNGTFRLQFPVHSTRLKRFMSSRAMVNEWNRFGGCTVARPLIGGLVFDCIALARSWLPLLTFLLITGCAVSAVHATFMMTGEEFNCTIVHACCTQKELFAEPI